MADVEKLNINNTDYDIADAKALRNKDVNATSFIDTKAGTTTYPTDNVALSQSIIIGQGAYHNNSTGGTRNVIIGNEAYGGASYQTAVGESAHCSANNYATAVGYNAGASSNYSTALGASSRAGNMGAVAIGYSASASTQYATAVGYGSSTSSNSYNTAIGANAAANAQYATVVGASAGVNTSAVRSTVLGYGSSATQQYATAIGSGAFAQAIYAAQIGSGTNTNYGSLQFRGWPLVDNGGKIYEERFPGTVRFATDEPTVLDWQNDEELRKMVFMYTGTDNDLFKHGLCYQAKAKQGHPKFYCGWTYRDFIPRNECVQIDNEKLFLKLAEISKARYEDEGDWRNSLIGGDNAEQSFYFYYDVDNAQWRIEIDSDTLERGFTGQPDDYYFEQGETLEDFGIYVKDLTLPTDEGADEEMIDIYYYAPCYCDGYNFGSDIYSVNYMKLMQTMIDSDWGFGYVIDDLESWEYEVDGTTYYMPVVPETYISKQDDEEYDGVTVRWEWDGSSWFQYINGENLAYDWTTEELEQTFGIVLDASEAETEYIEFYFRGAKQLYWQQFNPVDEAEFAKQEDLDALETEVQPLLDWKVNVQTGSMYNLNNYTTPGWYYFPRATSVTNRPSTTGIGFMLLVQKNSNNVISQHFFACASTNIISGTDYGHTTPMVYSRVYSSNYWYQWQSYLTSGSTANLITGYDFAKKQYLVHDTSANKLKWEEDSGGGSADDTYTNNTRNYIAVGNIIDNNGVISGFESVYPNGSSNIYAYSNITVPLGTNFEVGVKFTTGTVSADYSDQIISGETYPILSLNITNGKLVGQIGTTSDWDRNAFLTSTTSILSNSTYWAKLVHKNSLLQLYISTDGTNYNLEASASSTTSVPTTNIILGTGRSKNTAAFRGSIDLNETYVNSNDTRIWIGANYSELNNLSTVTDYYVNGSSWYKETFSDATRTKRIWLEQGGVASSSSATINLLKSFSDTNYVVTGGATNKTTSSFTLTNNANWVAIGV